MKFGEWLDMWFQYYCKPAIRETTAKGYENRIYCHIIPNLGNIPLNELTQSDIQAFYHKLKTSGRMQYTEIFGKGLSDRMIRGCHACCHAALEKAEAEKLIFKNPATGCKLPPKKAKEMSVLTPNEVYRFLKQAKYEGVYELCLLEISTGLRRGEIGGLKWEDLNPSTCELHIRRQVIITDDGLSTNAPKTKASIRTIILPEQLVNVLMEYKKNIKSDWMFPSPVNDEKPWHPKSLYVKVMKILEHAECKKVRFHDLRHTFATMALQNGMDVKTLSAMIGHISATTTLDIYSHNTAEMQIQAANQIERAMGRNVPIPVEDQVETTIEKPDIKPFTPYKGKIRKSGTGGIYEINDHLFEGRYSPTNAHGKRESHNVYAKTREECQAKLDAKIEEVRARIAAEKAAIELAASSEE